MWKNSLKNVESDNNKILYETLLDLFYIETVLTFWISLVFSYVYKLCSVEFMQRNTVYFITPLWSLKTKIQLY